MLGGAGGFQQRWLDVGLATEVEAGVVQWQALNETPEIELVAARPASKAKKEVTPKVG